MTIKPTGFQNNFTYISELWDTEDNLTYPDTLSHTLICSDITLTCGQRRGHASASSDRGRNRASEWGRGQDPGSWLWGAALGSVMTPFPTHPCTAWNRPRLSRATSPVATVSMCCTPHFQLTLESTPFFSISAALASLAQMSPKASFPTDLPLGLACSIPAPHVTNEHLKTKTLLHKTLQIAPTIFRADPQEYSGRESEHPSPNELFSWQLQEWGPLQLRNSLSFHCLCPYSCQRVLLNLPKRNV